MIPLEVKRVSSSSTTVEVKDTASLSYSLTRSCNVTMSSRSSVRADMLIGREHKLRHMQMISALPASNARLEVPKATATGLHLSRLTVRAM